MSRIYLRSVVVVTTVALLLGAVAVLAGCGSEDEGADPSSATSEQAPASESTVATTEAEGDGAGGQLTIYSGRTEELIGPLVEKFEQATGIETRVRYGDTAELAATILEEGENSPADVFVAQDAGALGAVAGAGRLRPLSADLLGRVDPRFRSAEGTWVGLSGRARVVVYGTQTVDPSELPDSIEGFTDPSWKGKIGWAPSNGSFQAFVTALRVSQGDEAARAWLEGIKANEPKVYEGNSAIVEAVGNGEIAVGFVNHYYLYRFLKEQGDGFPAANHYFPGSDIGNLVNVAGAGILDSARNEAAAQEFVTYMLSEEAQTHFAQETTEYPLVEGITVDPRLKPLAEIAMPAVDLSDLAGLEQTLVLLQEAGIL